MHFAFFNVCEKVFHMENFNLSDDDMMQLFLEIVYILRVSCT